MTTARLRQYSGNYIHYPVSAECRLNTTVSAETLHALLNFWRRAETCGHTPATNCKTPSDNMPEKNNYSILEYVNRVIAMHIALRRRGLGKRGNFSALS